MIKDSEVKRKWIEALRSGKYDQGHGTLRRKNTFCCLGVQLDIAGCRWEKVTQETMDDVIYIPYVNLTHVSGQGFWSYDYMEEIGLSSEEMRQLANMNDIGSSFNEIADYIEKNL